MPCAGQFRNLMIGTHRNTVSNALNLLRKLGYVSKQVRSICVVDTAGLKRWLDGKH